MAQWKKVLVSGSDIHISSITASNVPTEGTGTDRVLVRNATDGSIKSVLQSSIQGTTEATFQISGSTINDTSSFDGTSDVLLFTGSAGVSVDVAQDSSETTVTVNLPAGTISSSQQISLANTIGFESFSSSFATSISGNLVNVQDALSSITTLENTLSGLVASSSQLINASASLAPDLNSQSTSITSLQSSVTSLETFSSSVVDASQTGSFVVSASVLGTDDEIEVTANGAQGIQIGLPTNVSIPGLLEADAIVIQGQEQTETGVAIISGSTVFGTSGGNNTHRFTGSLQISGGLTINNTNANINISELDTDNTVGIDDIILRHSTTGILHTAGNAVATAVSGAFTSLSASFASTIGDLSTTTTTNNSSSIGLLQATSQSLLTSASDGIRFETNTAGTIAGASIGFSNTASFTAFGDGLTVKGNTVADFAGGGFNTQYTINPTTIGNTIGAFSSSAQLQNILDDIYLEISEGPISGALQLQELGFITASDFTQLVGVPSGLISGVLDGTSGTGQGTIRVNNNTVNIQGLGTSASPTFQNLTVTNNLTVNGDTTSLQVDNLNIEDQFILINSGAGDTNLKDGGIIVDNGGGSGSLFMYDFNAKAWGIKGATDDLSNKVEFNEVSNNDSEGAQIPDVYVGTISSSNNGVGGNPTDAPAYGVDGSTSKGQMHINTADSSIWIYA